MLLAVIVVWLFIGCRSNDDDTGEYSIHLSAHPSSIPADGISTSTIWAEVTVKDGNTPDSTLVRFVTTAGSIGENAYTVGGLATVQLISGTTPTVARVTAYVNYVTDDVQVMIGNTDTTSMRRD